MILLTPSPKTTCELRRKSVSGHHGRTGEVLDVGVTLAGSSDENLVLVSGMSARPLTVLGHVTLRKVTPLYFSRVRNAFTFFFLKTKTDVSIGSLSSRTTSTNQCM